MSQVLVVRFLLNVKLIDFVEIVKYWCVFAWN